MFAHSFLVTGAFVCAFNFIGYRLTAAPFNLSQTAISVVFIVYLTGIFGSTVVGKWAGRIGRRKVLWASDAAMLLGALLTWPESLLASGLGIAVIAVGFFAAHSIASSWVGLRAESARAQASAIFLVFFYVGSSLIGWLGGYCYDAGGWRGDAMLIAALAGGAIAVALRLSRTSPPEWMKAQT